MMSGDSPEDVPRLTVNGLLLIVATPSFNSVARSTSPAKFVSAQSHANHMSNEGMIGGEGNIRKVSSKAPGTNKFRARSLSLPPIS